MKLDKQKYLKYLGKDYENYIKGINTYNEKYGEFGGHRYDVCYFFEKIDNNKKIELIEFFKNTDKELFENLNKTHIKEEKILSGFKNLIDTHGDEIEKITGIYKDDLQYLFRGEKNKETKLTIQLVSAQVEYLK